ncbi:PREDICTED: uncharacterized protein LOC105556589 [Vollenhovia emeryi]|uniref:uncharacterized protein LOC105556589 n=1 Tax=Vollenhovia emeryi TaxID=411798 RepID=UPI0005F41A23|nr:PREDICTED: uncharacterized protein LOC105556589 [Vollenhovia emeryi]
MSTMSAEQISAELTTCVDVVEKVADNSKNLKGTFVRELRRSTRKIRAATAALMGRHVNTDPIEESSDRMERMRERIKELEKQVADLTRTRQQTREEEPKLHERTLRKRKYRRVAETSDEEEQEPPRASAMSRENDQNMAENDQYVAEEAASQRDENYPPLALRPSIRGERKVIEESPEERALEEVRRVMENISLESLFTGDAKSVRENLDSLIIRCVGARAILPKKRGTETAATKARSVAEAETKAQPAITKAEGQNKPDARQERKAAQQKQQPTGIQANKPVVQRPTTQQQQQRQQQPQNTWVEVVKRGLKSKAATAEQQKAQQKGATKSQDLAQQKGKGRGTEAPQKGNQPPRKADKRRNPRTQAVVLTFPPGLYAEGLRKIRSQVKLEDLGIEGLRPRRALTGALILEIPGENAKEKADQLTERIKGVVGDAEGIRVTRPTKLTEIRIKDLDDSVTQEEVREAVVRAGECSPQDVKIGQLRTAPNGLCTVWAQCPFATAKRVAASGRLRIGWMSARVDLLDARPLVCYRCLERGHVRQQCRSKVDRSSTCYRCGGEGHKAQNCNTEPKCPVCMEKGLPAKHKAGGKACKLPSKGEVRRRRKEDSGQQGTGGRPAPNTAVRTPTEEAMEVETTPVQATQKTPEVRGSEEAGEPAPSRL